MDRQGLAACFVAGWCAIGLAEDRCFYTPVTARKTDDGSEDDRFLFLGEELSYPEGDRTKRTQSYKTTMGNCRRR